MNFHFYDISKIDSVHLSRIQPTPYNPQFGGSEQDWENFMVRCCTKIGVYPLYNPSWPIDYFKFENVIKMVEKKNAEQRAQFEKWFKEEEEEEEKDAKQRAYLEQCFKEKKEEEKKEEVEKEPFYEELIEFKYQMLLLLRSLKDKSSSEKYVDLDIDEL